MATRVVQTCAIQSSRVKLLPVSCPLNQLSRYLKVPIMAGSFLPVGRGLWVVKDNNSRKIIEYKILIRTLKRKSTKFSKDN